MCRREPNASIRGRFGCLSSFFYCLFFLSFLFFFSFFFFFLLNRRFIFPFHRVGGKSKSQNANVRRFLCKKGIKKKKKKRWREKKNLTHGQNFVNPLFLTDTSVRGPVPHIVYACIHTHILFRLWIYIL